MSDFSHVARFGLLGLFVVGSLGCGGGPGRGGTAGLDPGEEPAPSGITVVHLGAPEGSVGLPSGRLVLARGVLGRLDEAGAAVTWSTARPALLGGETRGLWLQRDGSFVVEVGGALVYAANLDDAPFRVLGRKPELVSANVTPEVSAGPMLLSSPPRDRLFALDPAAERFEPLPTWLAA
ncbi:MAG TPA: hypothetical protein RMF84_18040, partial [Polyangiaceae bacterium LLY-WYZ-14_1]|nr:hypothetical protein [Polyangiaceae bacterium LLY-WYZ-14_1]